MELSWLADSVAKCKIARGLLGQTNWKKKTHLHKANEQRTPTKRLR